MENPWSGVVQIEIDGVKRPMSLTLGALAELEVDLGEDTLVALVERFESGGFSSSDVLGLIVAGLRGGGWEVERADLLAAEVSGGPMGAAKVAARLLARAFLLPEERRA
ncbi:gene transfer agent family protein [Planktotalea sp.]|uniref:gene transfer agent family protein n=1 Tax=Planktotalea sp. TaxID=2029877 RepID=UPI003D6C0E55